ncbi:isoleucine--tRNA ligase [Gemmatimonas sp.]|uniref:isoleucine--tRNA ligase n=1 Tax=Gemmatimonas sp. TaxID=1962908 RepID=UPI00286E3CD5|nr:isoleucine--tRNA ligase [Gemmatimonas sp.]
MTAPQDTATYPLLPDSGADAFEQELLARWEAEQLFERAQAARAGATPFVFYEGPPTANGRPGIHHVFSRTIKDLFCRHRAMQGYFVPRKAGWDTHGLPVEIEVEKELQREEAARQGVDPSEIAKLGGKQLIEQTGVAEFNRRCRESVFKYRGDWEKLSQRTAYWLDYDDPYVTYSHNFVESVWWALRTLHEKSLLVRGHKILPYCARCGTALSSHEVAQGYDDVDDPSVYVALDLLDEHGHAPAQRRRILVWTTTPWTLVSNTALAVNPTLTYIELRKKSGAEWTIILAEARVPGVLGADWADRWDVTGQMTGADLSGKRYRRPLDWVPYPDEGRHEVIVTEDFVSAEDGSGVVHMAPAFGADDYSAGQRHGLAFLQPVTARGEFTDDVPEVGGVFVKKADARIIEVLRERDVLWKATTFTHSYPHCWRCGTPLLYYARGSWFVRTTAVRESLMARNAAVDWHPNEVGTGRFGEWLANNVDWAISRDRYWGTPLPVWVNDEDATEIDVIGSYADLAARIGRPLPEDFDPHKPHIDQYTWPAPSGKGTMRRVPEVIDTWFDSGSMPFAQWHYPFENRDKVEAQFPADFICEGVDQTRGWFYSLIAIATGLGDALPNNADRTAAPYRHVVVNDLVLDAQGQKMSKSKGNTVDPWHVLERHGADAVRLFLVATSQVWVPRRFDENAIRETAGRFLLTFRNVYNGIFAQYANFGWSPSANDPAVADRPALDRWILSRLTRVEAEVDAHLNNYDATLAARRVMQFMDDDVSKWYVRQSRARFYEIDSADNRAAFATLHEVLAVTCRLLAPFAPFMTDAVHRALTGTSVHLASYTRADRTPVDDTLEAAMDDIRTLAGLARAARDVADINVRQPLPSVQCVVPGNPGPASELGALLASEINVKLVEFVRSTDALVSLEVKGNFRTLGKKFGKETPLVAAAVPDMPVELIRILAGGESVTIEVEGIPRLIAPDDVAIIRRASGAAVVQENGGYGVALDPTITPELRAEGLAREVISKVQRLRKEAQLDVSDRIAVAIAGDEELEGAVATHRGRIADEVLAVRLLVGTEAGSPFHADGNGSTWTATQVVDVDGRSIRLALTKEGS